MTSPLDADGEAGGALRAALDAHLGPAAVATVTLGRDASDAFVFAVEPRSGAAPTRDELLALVPPGSRWAPARGWASVVGRPLHAGGRTLFAVGVEAVHARGPASAFPSLRAHLHATPPVEALRGMARELDCGRGEGRAPAEAQAAVILRMIAGRTPAATLDDQAALLRQTAELLRQGRGPLFRTIVLAEDELRPFLAFPARLPAGVDGALLGLAEAITRGFGAWTTARVQLRRWWQPG